jgi:short-subunit dehydrogenase
VINNAGYGLFGAAKEQIVHVISTNLVGSIQVTRADRDPGGEP